MCVHLWKAINHLLKNLLKFPVADPKCSILMRNGFFINPLNPSIIYIFILISFSSLISLTLVDLPVSGRGSWGHARQRAPKNLRYVWTLVGLQPIWGWVQHRKLISQTVCGRSLGSASELYLTLKPSVRLMWLLRTSRVVSGRPNRPLRSSAWKWLQAEEELAALLIVIPSNRSSRVFSHEHLLVWAHTLTE